MFFFVFVGAVVIKTQKIMQVSIRKLRERTPPSRGPSSWLVFPFFLRVCHDFFSHFDLYPFTLEPFGWSRHTLAAFSGVSWLGGERR